MSKSNKLAYSFNSTNIMNDSRHEQKLTLRRRRLSSGIRIDLLDINGGVRFFRLVATTCRLCGRGLIGFLTYLLFYHTVRQWQWHNTTELFVVNV